MVEVLRGNGIHYKDFAQRRGIDLSRYRFINFPMRDGTDEPCSGEIETILRLSTIPQFYRKSHLITGVTDNRGRNVRVVAVPQECPFIDISSSSQEAPTSNVDELYIVEVSRKHGNRKGQDFLVLVDNDLSAARIAQDIAGRRWGCPRTELVANPRKVSEEEFLRKCLELMEQGIRPPDQVLKVNSQLQQRVRELGLIPADYRF